MPEPTLGIVGTGRLGRAVRDLAVSEGHPVTLLDPRQPGSWDARTAVDAVVDCSAPAAVGAAARLCRRLGVPLVECVSGLGTEERRLLDGLSAEVPVVLAPNLSLGNYLQTRALRLVAEVVTTMERAGITGAVPQTAVLERHPATKAHRPSTTAERLAHEWRRHTGRPAADIGSLRCGPAVSDHEVRLMWPEQSLTISHSVTSLDAAAAGAIGAAGWAVGQAPGTYTIHAVFDDLLATMARAAGDGTNGKEDDR
ncbi:dihydrodipicolinate reductase C-terminal domain-containing protein [Streptomyces sp. SudanB182_2057]|uniref:dihydrodipicolinate reductase C-terminal domain-containing protein n=1 Tax=Streptomyces sp. SudanB182_2057 TaxID=3035281 RepID=UPI003F557A5D